MKIFLNKANENWVLDRITEEWYSGNGDISTHNINEADIIWIISAWLWKDIPLHLLESKKVVTTIHHVVPNKFDENGFKERDVYVDCYHVPNNYTKDFIKNYTNKKIKVISYWANPKLWFNLNKINCRNEMKLPLDKYLIGSFQRDTEGYDLATPKLEKGPDIFCDMVEKINESNDIEVVLGGWRRQYIMNRLDNVGIKYHYFELPPFDTINKLYNCLDLYIVGSRYEGGPQSILECALTKTPIISTDVGIANLVLSKNSIYGNEQSEVTPNVDVAYDNVQTYCMDTWFDEYKKLFKEIL